jgi:hypothetical protein
MRRVRRGPILLAAAIAILSSSFPGTVGRVRAAEYILESDATYDVRPADRRIDVGVDLTFTNTTPDPSGGFSVFDTLSVAIQDQATEVSASDDEGELDVSVKVQQGVRVATVELRDGLRYEDAANVDLTYQLPDSDDPQLRVRPSVVVFPAWSFGTSGEVMVQIPTGYEVRVDGDSLTADGATLSSGPIDDPSAWLALVTAVHAQDYTEYEANVPLDGGTADLLVRAFADDPDWGEEVSQVVTDGLPGIEAAIGLPYPHVGQLVLVESVPTSTAGFGESEGTGTEVPVAYDQPSFTALHQVAHLWLTPALVDARWIREGLSSHVAATVAADLGSDPPFDPAEVAADHADAAFPLDAWPPTADGDGVAYGYAASWAAIDELDAMAGADALREVLARVQASIGPYDGAEITPLPEAEAPPAFPLTSRGFLDQLETVSDTDVEPLFAERILVEADIALLPTRAEARDAFDALVTGSDGWGAPDPIRLAMTEWRFDDAQSQIALASGWLERRDELSRAMEDAGLSAPDRLQQAYRAYGGGPEATDELEAETAVVSAYVAAGDRVNAPRSLFERLGLIGGADPAAQLALAQGRFTDGDLRGALGDIAEAQRIVAAAETGGIVRIVSLVLLVAALAVAALVVFRRRASYTAAP